MSMSDMTVRAVDEWRDQQAARGNVMGFSDAIEELVGAAAHFYTERSTNRFRPLENVMGPLWSEPCSWIQIDGHTGRRVRCSRCGKTRLLTATRFGQLVLGVVEFVTDHQGCQERAEEADAP